MGHDPNKHVCPVDLYVKCIALGDSIKLAKKKNTDVEVFKSLSRIYKAGDTS